MTNYKFIEILERNLSKIAKIHKARRKKVLDEIRKRRARSR